MEISNYFSVPVGQWDLNFDVISLKKYCYDVKKNTIKSNIGSNKNAWQSVSLKITEQHKLTPLVKNILHCGQKIFEHLNGNVEKYTLGLDNMCININPKGGYNINHLPPHAFLTGAYYIEVPEGSGRLSLRHPCPFLEYDWEHFHWKDYTADTAPTRYLTSKSNRLYIFPGWVSHEVEVNTSEYDRIAISFNLRLINNDKLK